MTAEMTAGLTLEETTAAGPAPIVAELAVEPAVGGFVGRPHEGRPTVAYGGAVLGQALAAARATVPAERRTHSLHCYFIAGVDPRTDAHYRTHALRDGRSYSARRVEVMQGGQEVATVQCSFAESSGRGTKLRQPAMPAVPDPEGLPDGFWFRDPASHLRATLECREVSVSTDPMTEEVEKLTWFRSAGRLPDDPAVHEAALAYLSDITLSPTALVAHGFGPDRDRRDARVASLDHALWFHRPFRADEWLLYRQRSVVEGESRALAHGELFDRDGVLVASVAQEALVIIYRPAQGQPAQS
jgi:acyl-CoA thioesterase-2